MRGYKSTDQFYSFLEVTTTSWIINLTLIMYFLENYVQRWGTHFIKSAKFGGQLEIRKTMDAEEAKSKKELEIQMEMEFKTLFASIGAKASAQEGESSRKQSKTTSTSVVAHGGSQDIASILSDVYSPTFKSEFKEWLKTISNLSKGF